MSRRKVTDALLAEVNRMDLAGHTQDEIAEFCDCSQRSISKWVRRLRIERRDARNMDASTFIDRLDTLIQELWAEWRTARDDNGNRIPGHGSNLLRAIQEQARILGYGTAKVDVNVGTAEPPPQLISLIVKDRDQLDSIMKIDEFQELLEVPKEKA